MRLPQEGVIPTPFRAEESRVQRHTISPGIIRTLLATFSRRHS